MYRFIDNLSVNKLLNTSFEIKQVALGPNYVFVEGLGPNVRDVRSQGFIQPQKCHQGLLEAQNHFRGCHQTRYRPEAGVFLS